MQTSAPRSLALAFLSIVQASAAPQGLERYPLEFPDDDDGAIAAVFTADGSELLIAHEDSGSVTRLDVSSGTVLQSIDLGSSAQLISLDEAGGRVLVADIEDEVLHVLTSSPLALLGSIPFSVNEPFRLHVDDGSNRAMLAGIGSVSILDLSTFTEEREIPLDPFSPFQTIAERAILTPDGQSVILYSDLSGPPILSVVNINTGTTTQTVNPPPDSYLSLAPSPDRSTFVLAASSIFGMGSASLYRFDTSSLALLSTTTLDQMPLAIVTQVRNSGDRAMVLTVTGPMVVPLVQGTINLGSPGVTALPRELVAAAGQEIEKVGTWGDADDIAVFDANTGTVSRTTGARRTYRGSLVASRQGNRFAGLGVRPMEDRVILFEEQAGVIAALGEVNSGLGLESDQLLSLDILPGTSSGVVYATESDLALIVDLRTGQVTSTLPLGAQPRCSRLLESGRIAVGHHTGALMEIDPSTAVVLQTIQLGAPIQEILPSTQPQRVWIRAGTSGSDSLLLVDLAAGVELTRIALTGVSTPNYETFPFSWETIAVDESGARAYAVHSPTGAVDVIDLAQGLVVATLQAPNGSESPRQSLLLSADASRLYRTSSTPSATVYDTTSTTPTLLWHETVPSNPNTFMGTRNPGARLSADEGALFVDFTTFGVIPFPQGPGFVALDAANGQMLDTIGIIRLNSFDTDGDDLLLSRYFGMRVLKWTGTQFGPLEERPVAGSVVTGTSLDRASGLGVAIARLTANGSPQDLLTLDLFDGRTAVACDGGTPNAAGVQATLAVSGSPFAGGTLNVRTSGLQPGGMFGLLVLGDLRTSPTPITGGLGSLCVGGLLGRFNAQVQTADAAGTQNYVVETASVPTAMGAMPILPGDSWTFQTWHRDVASGGAATSNTSTALEVTFR